jgi:NAD(P)-dependent dehydrogenase (short-subunit alcohol dehydrogenase family)
MTPQRIKQVNKTARKVALVTGGAIRLGRAISLELARAGFDVAVNYHRSAAGARDTAAAIHALGARAVSICADVAKPAEARRLVAETVRRLGRLDLLVNNAGVFWRTPWNTVTPADFDRFIAVNVKGAFFCSQAAARAMGRRGGRIINLADVGAERAWAGYIPYVISKAGVVMLTRGLAAALAPRIQVNAVGPGAVLLPEGFPRESKRRLRAKIPMARLGHPDDVAAAVRFFATCPAYITGQVLYVDGGATAI